MGSTYSIPTTNPDHHRATTGWDDSLATFYADVRDLRSKDDEFAGVLLNIGNVPGEVQTIVHLQAKLGDYASIPLDVGESLEADRNRNSQEVQVQQATSVSLYLLKYLGQPVDASVVQLETDRYMLKESLIQPVQKYPGGEFEGRQLEVFDKTQEAPTPVLIAQVSRDAMPDESKVIYCKADPRKLLDHLSATLSPETAIMQSQIMRQVRNQSMAIFQDEDSKLTMTFLETLPGCKSPMLLLATGDDDAQIKLVSAILNPHQNPQEVCKAFQEFGIFEQQIELWQSIERHNRSIETESDRSRVALVPEERVEAFRESVRHKVKTSAELWSAQENPEYITLSGVITMATTEISSKTMNDIIQALEQGRTLSYLPDENFPEQEVKVYLESARSINDSGNEVLASRVIVQLTDIEQVDGQWQERGDDREIIAFDPKDKDLQHKLSQSFARFNVDSEQLMASSASAGTESDRLQAQVSDPMNKTAHIMTDPPNDKTVIVGSAALVIAKALNQKPKITDETGIPCICLNGDVPQSLDWAQKVLKNVGFESFHVEEKPVRSPSSKAMVGIEH